MGAAAGWGRRSRVRAFDPNSHACCALVRDLHGPHTLTFSTFFAGIFTKLRAGYHPIEMTGRRVFNAGSPVQTHRHGRALPFETVHHHANQIRLDDVVAVGDHAYLDRRRRLDQARIIWNIADTFERRRWAGQQPQRSRGNGNLGGSGSRQCPYHPRIGWAAAPHFARNGPVHAIPAPRRCAAPGPLRTRLFASVTAGFAPSVTRRLAGLAGPLPSAAPVALGGPDCITSSPPPKSTRR